MALNGSKTDLSFRPSLHGKFAGESEELQRQTLRRVRASLPQARAGIGAGFKALARSMPRKRPDVKTILVTYRTINAHRGLQCTGLSKLYA